MLRELRRRAGKLRNELLYGARDRRLAQAADAAREGWVAEARAALQPLPPPDTVRAELHTLCGEGQKDMGIWATWSMLRFLGDVRLVVHSDGTLSEATKAEWRALHPGMRIVDPDEALAALETRLKPFPHVLDWTKRYHFGFKLGGLHAQVEAPRMIDMDTDVLVLSEPYAVRAFLDDPARSMAWNRDHKPCYAYPEALFREILGDRIGPLPDRLNGGFMMTRRLDDDDWAFFDEVIALLDADPRTDVLRYWMHQTLFALLASTREPGSAEGLPEGYEIYPGATRPETVVRHYVGSPSVRPRFFTEGVARVLEDARRRGGLA